MRINSIVIAILPLLMTTAIAAQQTDFESLDENSDGNVSVAEFKEYVSGKLPGFEMLDEFAKKVDTDANGQISEAEFDSRMEILATIREMQDEVPETDQGTPKDESHAGDEEAFKAVEGVYKKLTKLVSDEKWDSISKHMTEEACEDFCFETATMGIAFAKMELPMEIPGLSDAKDAVQEVIEVYGLDELDIELGSMIQMSIDDGSGSDTPDIDAEEEDLKDRQANNKKKIIAALDKDGKRWEIIAAIWKAQSQSPMLHSPLNGVIDQTEMDDDVCYLTVSSKPPEMGEGGVQIQIMSPPTIIRMEKGETGWKYAGRDPERTQKAMQKFMEKMQGSGGTGRTDF